MKTGYGGELSQTKALNKLFTTHTLKLIISMQGWPQNQNFVRMWSKKHTFENRGMSPRAQIFTNYRIEHIERKP
jgi:GH18 family chitinase